MLVSSQSDSLRRIRDRCREVLQCVGPSLPGPHSSPHPSSDVRISQPSLPYPAPIVTTLLQVGSTFHLADMVSRAYLRSALTLKHEYERHIQEVSRVWVETSLPDPAIPSQIASIYNISATRYQESLNTITERIVSLVCTKHATPLAKKERRPTFNKSVTPILEDFYSNNPFPSPSDKQKLTRETSLTLDQIRIWFQNRRARARRAGQTPTRKNHPADFIIRNSPNIPSDLESEVNRLIDNELTRSRHARPIGVSVIDEQLSSVLWPKDSPEHAFPSPYPPTCEIDPFPVKGGLSNFDVPWIRESRGASAVTRHSVQDISDLANDLAALFISDPAGCSTTTEGSIDRFLIPSMWVPVKTAPLVPIVSSVTASTSEQRFSKSKLSARTRLRGALALQLSPEGISPRAKPYPRSKPQPSLPRRIPQSQPQLINYRHSQVSRSPSASSSTSDDSLSSYTSSSDSELGTPPPISADLPIYLSENESPSSYIYPINPPKLPKVFSKLPTVPRTYTFRTTIAPS